MINLFLSAWCSFDASNFVRRGKFNGNTLSWTHPWSSCWIPNGFFMSWLAIAWVEQQPLEVKTLKSKLSSPQLWMGHLLPFLRRWLQWNSSEKQSESIARPTGSRWQQTHGTCDPLQLWAFPISCIANRWTRDSNPKGPDVVLVDASQLMYCVVWPSVGTVADLAASMGKLLLPYKTQTLVIFDQYENIPAKDHERQRRARVGLYRV